MKKIIIRVPEIDYVLIHWEENIVTPWVAAWAYNDETGSWGQGHYFRTESDAREYLAETFKEHFPVYLARRVDEIFLGGKS